MAQMNSSLARGYASQLIRSTKSAADLCTHLNAGLYQRVNAQFDKVCATKKVDRIGFKMRRACNAQLRVRIPHWGRHKATVVLDTIRADPNAPAYNYFYPGQVRWREDRLMMYTIFCTRDGDAISSYQMAGPTIGHHAISRLLQRGAATPDTLQDTCRAALDRARDAVALLREEDDVFELLLPFAKGAIAVQVDGSRANEGLSDQPPLLSVRTYLTEEMLSAENLDRILDLEAFYLEGAWSDTERYRELLEANRSFRGNIAPEDRPALESVDMEEGLEASTEIAPLTATSEALEICA